MQLYFSGTDQYNHTTKQAHIRSVNPLQRNRTKQNRHKDQLNRPEDLDMNPDNYTHLFFDKGAQTCNGEMTASLKNVTGKTGCLQTEN
jgi:hypothetical protein